MCISCLKGFSRAFAIAATVVVASASGTGAGQECECVGNGKRVKEGTVLCLQISPSVRYLARCERVLNNTSWKRLSDDGCPSVRMTPLPGQTEPLPASG